jgi:hypothetical protein
MADAKTCPWCGKVISKQKAACWEHDDPERALVAWTECELPEEEVS